MSMRATPCSDRKHRDPLSLVRRRQEPKRLLEVTASLEPLRRAYL